MASHPSHTSSFLTPVDVKLNQTNYKEWHTTVRVILYGLDLFGHVDGTTLPPAESSFLGSGDSSRSTLASSDSSAWHAADHRAMAIIYQSCELDV